MADELDAPSTWGRDRPEPSEPWTERDPAWYRSAPLPDHPPLEHAAWFWITTWNETSRSADTGPLKALRGHILGPIAVLSTFGPHEALRSRAEKLRAAHSEAVEAAHLSEDEENAEHWRADRALGALLRRLEWLASRVQKAEELLNDAGFEFKHDEALVEDVTGDGRGRRKQLLTLAVGLTWRDERPDFIEETGNRDYAPVELQERIAERLRREFPEERLTTGSNSQIESAIHRFRRNKETYLAIIERIEEIR